MATCTHIETVEHTAGLHRLGAAVTKAWHGYWEYRANRAAVAMLQSMDGQTLRDMGISRGDIESVVAHGRSREDSRR